VQPRVKSLARVLTEGTGSPDHPGVLTGGGHWLSVCTSCSGIEDLPLERQILTSTPLAYIWRPQGNDWREERKKIISHLCLGHFRKYAGDREISGGGLASSNFISLLASTHRAPVFLRPSIAQTVGQGPARMGGRGPICRHLTGGLPRGGALYPCFPVGWLVSAEPLAAELTALW